LNAQVGGGTIRARDQWANAISTGGHTFHVSVIPLGGGLVPMAPMGVSLAGGGAGGEYQFEFETMRQPNIFYNVTVSVELPEIRKRFSADSLGNLVVTIDTINVSHTLDNMPVWFQTIEGET
jgi:hypothetical protein